MSRGLRAGSMGDDARDDRVDADRPPADPHGLRAQPDRHHLSGRAGGAGSLADHAGLARQPAARPLALAGAGPAGALFHRPGADRCRPADRVQRAGARLVADPAVRGQLPGLLPARGPRARPPPGVCLGIGPGRPALPVRRSGGRIRLENGLCQAGHGFGHPPAGDAAHGGGHPPAGPADCPPASGRPQSRARLPLAQRHSDADRRAGGAAQPDAQARLRATPLAVAGLAAAARPDGRDHRRLAQGLCPLRRRRLARREGQDQV